MANQSEPQATISFSTATETDTETLCRFIESYYQFNHIPFHAAEIRSGLRQLFQDESAGRAWLILRQSQPVGYALITFGFDLEFGGRLALLTDLYLDPAHRGQGIGRKTLAHVEAYCHQAGIKTLELQVDQTNTAAYSFYLRCGFQAHQRIPLSKRLRSS